MTSQPSVPVVPGEHLIVIAARRRDVAHGCQKALTQAGYPVVLCPEGFTGEDVLKTVQAHYPHLLIVDDDVEWAPGIHIVQRLHADPAFTALPALLLVRLNIGLPRWMWEDRSINAQLTKPFALEELLAFVRRIFEAILAGGGLFPDPAVSSAFTEEDWREWKHSLFPFERNRD